MTVSERRRHVTALFVVCSMIGIASVAGGLGIDLVQGRELHVGPFQAFILAVGGLFLTLAILLRGDRLPRLAPVVALAATSAVVAIVLAEATFRVLGYDFQETERRLSETPIYYQMPREPSGAIYFRRAGPAVWRGKVISTQLANWNAIDAETAYEGEEPIEVHYDENGFRNPDDLADWEVVVVGDSFVELGYLGYDQLFTTLLANFLGVRVKNLGVSYTGAFSHIHYLKTYGVSPSTRQAALVFFEGNDLVDLMREKSQFDNYRRTGRREYRRVEERKQTSILEAVVERLSGPDSDRRVRNALFVRGSDTIPITVSYSPPGSRELERETVETIEEAIRGWAVAARCHGLVPWLVFMPAKRRVLHGNVRFLDNARADLVEWRPTDLPNFIASIALRNGVTFIDVTDALVEGVRHGPLPYNGLFDTHLSAKGSRIVAETIAAAMRDAVEAPADGDPAATHRDVSAPGATTGPEPCRVVSDS